MYCLYKAFFFCYHSNTIKHLASGLLVSIQNTEKIRYGQIFSPVEDIIEEEAHQLMVCLVNILKSLLAIFCLAQGTTKWRELAGCIAKYALLQLPRSARASCFMCCGTHCTTAHKTASGPLWTPPRAPSRTPSHSPSTASRSAFVRGTWPS